MRLQRLIPALALALTVAPFLVRGDSGDSQLQQQTLNDEASWSQRFLSFFFRPTKSSNNVVPAVPSCEQEMSRALKEYSSTWKNYVTNVKHNADAEREYSDKISLLKKLNLRKASPEAICKVEPEDSEDTVKWAEFLYFWTKFYPQWQDVITNIRENHQAFFKIWHQEIPDQMVLVDLKWKNIYDKSKTQHLVHQYDELKKQFHVQEFVFQTMDTEPFTQLRSQFRSFYDQFIQCVYELKKAEDAMKADVPPPPPSSWYSFQPPRWLLLRPAEKQTSTPPTPPTSTGGHFRPSATTPPTKEAMFTALEAMMTEGMDAELVASMKRMNHFLSVTAAGLEK